MGRWKARFGSSLRKRGLEGGAEAGLNGVMMREEFESPEKCSGGRVVAGDEEAQELLTCQIICSYRGE